MSCCTLSALWSDHNSTVYAYSVASSSLSTSQLTYFRSTTYDTLHKVWSHCSNMLQQASIQDAGSYSNACVTFV